MAGVELVQFTDIGAIGLRTVPFPRTPQPPPSGQTVSANRCQREPDRLTGAPCLARASEYEWKPGRLRLRGGTYWEPSRFDGVDGRLHYTFGAELALFQFPLLGEHRLDLSFTGDVAARYRNVGISIGF